MLLTRFIAKILLLCVLAHELYFIFFFTKLPVINCNCVGVSYIVLCVTLKTKNIFY